ncbi:MAG: type I-E CRISPR-associated endoribonuclease Cas2e [Ruminococcus sp.]|jgi:CRISPR-associated protein Cas2
MVVVVLNDCPPKLRGDLSKWLFEINTGVYVGNISARVRELLWKRICENVKHGQATMVYPAQGEQKLEFCVHNTNWKVVDFDGIKLMQRPSVLDTKVGHEFGSERFSKFHHYKKSNQMQIAKQKAVQMMDDYIVLDIETTGLSHLTDEIIEIGALHVFEGKPRSEFQCLVQCDKKIPEHIKKLTGITDEDLLNDGRELRSVLQKLLNFITDRPVVCHNAAFDLNFIQVTCKKENLPVPRNKCIDTVILAKRRLKRLKDYKLQTIANELSVDITGIHRALNDCYITYEIFKKLNENWND